MAYNGKDLVLKIGDGATPTENFTTVTAMKNASFTNQRGTVDVTTKDSAGFRELLGTAAIASGQISGSGVWTETATQILLQTLSMTGAFANFQIVFGSGDKYLFKGVVTNFQMQGGTDDAQMYSVTIESTGIVQITRGS